MLLSSFELSCCQLRIRERREHRVFETLLQSVPGLEERLMEGSDEQVSHVADLVRMNCSLCM